MILLAVRDILTTLVASVPVMQAVAMILESYLGLGAALANESALQAKYLHAAHGHKGQNWKQTSQG